MGFFGSKAPAANSGAFDPLPLSGGDRAKIFAAELLVPGLGQRIRYDKTVRPVQRAFTADLMQRLQGTPDSVQQASISANDGTDITSGFAPQYDMVPGRAPLSVSDPELPALAFKAKQLGIDIAPMLEVLKAQAPEYDYVNGQRVVKRGVGSGNNPNFIPKYGEGMQPGPGGSIQNAPGYVKSAAEAAGAVTGAQESSKAAYDLVDYDLGGGNVIKLPRAYVGAMNMKLMQGRGQPGSIGPDGSSGEPPMSGMPGVARSPGQLEADKVDYQEGAKAVAGAQEASTAAATNARNASMAFDGILQLNPNQATPFIVGAKKLMATLHPDNPELQQYVGSAEGYRMLTTRMVLPKAKELGANPSNKDSEIIFKSMPGLTTPRAAGAVYFGMEAATANKEAARQAFFQNWQGDQRASAMKRAWANSPEAKKSIFQDPIFSRLTLNGHPAVVYKTSRDGRKFGVFMPYNADGSVNKSAQVFEAY